nr:hypothetical protein [Armatimonas sp.]
MPATLTNLQIIPPPPTVLTEVLIQTITSNAQMLRLLDPERYRQLLETLPSATPPTLAPSEGNMDAAWDDLERWLVALREQDRAAVEP